MNYTGINKNIMECSKVFAEQVEELSKTVFELAKYYEVMGTMYKGLDIKNMYQVHKFMSDVFTCWGNTYVEQGQLMKEKFSKFFMYHTHEGEPLRELIKKRFSIKEQYVKAEIKLGERKDRLFKSQDVKKWELSKEGLNKIAELKQSEDKAKEYMLPTETKHVEDKRHLLNYYSNQVKQQVVDMWNNNYLDTSIHLMEVACQHKEIASKLVGNWNNLFDHFKGMDVNMYDDTIEYGAEEEKKDVPKTTPSPQKKPESKPKTAKEENPAKPNEKESNGSDADVEQDDDIEHEVESAPASNKKAEPQKKPPENSDDEDDVFDNPFGE